MSNVRYAALITLRAGAVDEYERLHAEVWPEVLERLRASHVRNYSIFRHGQLLFSYLEYTGDDYAGDMALIAADPATQRWWALTAPLQQPVADAAADDWWFAMPEVFHMD